VTKTITNNLAHHPDPRMPKAFMPGSECMWWALQKHKVSTKYITLIKDMYDNVVPSVRTSDRDTNDFPINIGLHQGSALSPYLFALVMDEVTRDNKVVSLVYALCR
jgi:hypothetical protein